MLAVALLVLAAGLLLLLKGWKGQSWAEVWASFGSSTTKGGGA